MMKNYLTLLLMFVLSISAYSQEDNISWPKEFTFNAFDFIGFGRVGVMYEDYYSKNTSVGADISLKVSNDDFERIFSGTFFLRQYFGKQTDRGFFLEYFTSLVLDDGPTIYYASYPECLECDYIVPPYNPTPEKNLLGLSLGIGIGNKIVSNERFVSHVYFGVGRVLVNNEFREPVYVRFGINIGLRNKKKS